MRSKFGSKIGSLLAIGTAMLGWSGSAHAFCGFYVAKADSKLFNKASQVVMVRDDDKTVMTISNDFQGDLTDFAIVIPVPTALTKEQVHVGERALLEKIDAYSSPRLVEYTDMNPCEINRYKVMEMAPSAAAGGAMDKDELAARAKSLGVKIEASYTVGEYDIVILAAKQSNGLETWLHEAGYRIPKGASKVLGSYIKQDMHFFVAKVNLKEQAKTGYTYLRPIQVAYASPKFMLPIRLGTVNADGPQELFVYALTRKGRVETTNYKTKKLPTGENVPEYVKDEFGKFYKSMFAEQVKKDGMTTVFTEYAWDMSGFCDPCVTEPPTNEELRKLGVFWLATGDPNQPRQYYNGMYEGAGTPVFLTRLHVRYDGEHFPEDLVFQETTDRADFQGRYVLQHPFPGWETAKCDAMKDYKKQLVTRHEQEAKNLAELTGWKLADIRTKMGIDAEKQKADDDDKSWFRNLWK